jgi:hypothetical protein
MRLMRLSFALLLLLVPSASQPQDNNPITDKNFVPIKDIVKVVETSLDVVKAQLQKTDPQLKTAEFDFQTVSTKDVTGGLFASIVTVQAEHKNIATRETDFVYSVPDKQTALLKLQKLKSQHYDFRLETDCTQDVVSMVTCLWNKLNRTTDPEEVAETLPGAIVAAAQAARDVSRVRNSTGSDLTHRQFIITLTYQVNNSFSAGADPSSLISVGPQAKYSGETDRTQTLKLTFEDPTK